MKLRRGLAAASLALSAGAVVAGPAPFACAGPGPDATLVIDTGSSEQMLCVALDADSVSGLRLIELAGQQHGLSYSFGYQGQAVCMLAGVGSSEEECFEGGQPFWGYWRSNGSSWTWSGTGAGGTVVEDGDVEGWSWGTGNDGSSHQQPPMTSHEAVCGPEEQPSGGGGGKGSKGGDTGGGDKPASGGGGNGSDNGTGEPSSSGPTSGASTDDPEELGETSRKEQGDGSKRQKQDDKDDRKKGSTEKGNAIAEQDPAVVATDIASDPTPSSAPAASSSDAPPAAGIAGLAVAIAFGLAGAWFVKRRHLPSG